MGTHEHHARSLNEALGTLYGETEVAALMAELLPMLREPQASPDSPSFPDVIVSAYANAFGDGTGTSPLTVLHDFMVRYLGDAVSHLHILPPYESSGDFGFAVDDYAAIRPDLGDWADIDRLSAGHRLVMDFVINHVGVGCSWFRRARAGSREHLKFFIEDHGFDTSLLTRTATPFRNYILAGREVSLWSTFTESQVDLDYRNPAVFLAMAKELIGLLRRGVGVLRLDALVFAWKQDGTSCAGLPQIVGLTSAFRHVAELCRPGTLFIGEVDAQSAGGPLVDAGAIDLAYRYEVPPILAYTYLSGDGSTLAAWLEEREFANDARWSLIPFGTHDGIFLRPYDPPLNDAQLHLLSSSARRHDAVVPEVEVGGKVRPYELDIAIPDLLNESAAQYPGALKLFLSLPGVPLLSFRNLFGAGSDRELARASGVPRAVNRGYVSPQGIEGRPEQHPNSVLRNALQVLQVRRRYDPVFRPESPVSKVRLDSGVLSFERGDGLLRVLANLTREAVVCRHDEAAVRLEPYEVVWIHRQDVSYSRGRRGIRRRRVGLDTYGLRELNP